MKRTVCDISGMGGRENHGYEWGCQVVCARALRFLQTLTESAEYPKYHTYENITGILASDNEVARKMDEYVLAHPLLREYGVTGAMHQFAVTHALKIRELGREEYMRQMRECRDADSFFEFNDDEAFTDEERKAMTNAK